MGARLNCKCLCGAVTFSAEPSEMKMGVCHCSMCRHWSGGVFMAVGCGESVEFKDETSIGVYKSSQWGERVFCKECGSSLMWRTADQKHQSVSAQAFEDVNHFDFTNQIFIDDKPGNYSFAQSTHNMTGAEIFAMFAPSPTEQKDG